MGGGSRILIAGAGIGGLTTALTLRRAGFSVTVLETADALQEVGAGVQLSPNASRVLIDLGLESALNPHAVSPEALAVMSLGSGKELVRARLDTTAARYGAPFWVIHRGTLQQVLAHRVMETPGIDLHLGVRVEKFGGRDARVVAAGRTRAAMVQFEGAGLVGADGIWSVVREQMGIDARPAFCGQTAWRALLDASAVDPRWRRPQTTLWLGPHAHVVHYPIAGGACINVVVIIREDWSTPAWSEPGDPDVLRARAARWAPPVRELVGLPQRWEKWALHEMPPLPAWGGGLVTLLGDAAHAMRPFLAQGASMAIEDAAVLARGLSERPDEIEAAFRAYESLRRSRTARVQREAARQAWRYGLRGPLAMARNLVLRRMGGERLLRRYDWIYSWTDD